MNEDWREVKWVMIPLTALALGMGVSLSFQSYTDGVKRQAEALETKTAMENGYRQVIEDGEKVWRKVD